MVTIVEWKTAALSVENPSNHSFLLTCKWKSSMKV